MPKRIHQCYSRIIYNKKSEEYYTDWDHSDYCKKEQIPIFENIGDINEQIENYKSLRNTLTKYLNSHPTISVSDFIKKGYTLYNKNQCKFKIEKHTFKNLYYN